MLSLLRDHTTLFIYQEGNVLSEQKVRISYSTEFLSFCTTITFSYLRFATPDLFGNDILT